MTQAFDCAASARQIPSNGLIRTEVGSFMGCDALRCARPNVEGNRRAALPMTEDQVVCRRVRLTERLALGCRQERIFAPITETSKLATVELDEFAKRIEAEPTVKG